MSRIHRLTARDRSVLELIDSYGMLSTSQIKQLMFEEVNKRTMLRRLRILEKTKNLNRITGLSRGELVWILSSKATKLIGSDLLIKGVNRNTLEHDILINDCRISLKDMGKHWISGHVLRKDMASSSGYRSGDEAIIPDSLFALNTKAGLKTISLEVELIAKSKRRYERLMDLYQDNSDIDYVWYIVPSASIGKKVLQQVRIDSYRKSYDWAMYTLLDELRINPLEAKLNFKKKRISLKDFYQVETRKNHQKLAHSEVHSVGSLEIKEDVWSELN
ncbi:MAG: replication-relaxation family protein [Bdellovibrionales bacterium]|nr:replication-relaxation family protein [Bdellovibrionales bacterium]